MIGKKSKWVVDKNGVETTSHIIDPIIDGIKALAIKFHTVNCMNFNKVNIDPDKVILINDLYVELMNDINNRKIHKGVLKYIAHHLYFNKDKIKKLKNC